MYVDCDNTITYQGDIVQGFLFSAIEQPAHDSFNADNLDAYDAKPRLSYGPAMIVSNTCDITRRPFVSVVRIFPLQTLVDAHKANGKSDQNIANEIAQLKAQKTFYYYYIAEDTMRGIQEGYADLTFINPVELKQVSLLKRLASLGSYERHVLAYKLGNMFMRPH